MEVEVWFIVLKLKMQVKFEICAHKHWSMIRPLKVTAQIDKF